MTKYDVLCLYKTKDITMDILKHMVDLASRCGYVTVNEYLEMSGIDECMKGGNEWGWYAKTIMDTVGIKTRCGWILDLGDPCFVLPEKPNGQTDATEVTFDRTQADYLARQILADLAGGTVNDTTNSLTAKFIFGNDHPHRSGKYPFSYGQNMYNGILIGYAEKSIQNYIENGNLHNLKAARDILTTAIVKLEDEESEEK